MDADRIVAEIGPDLGAITEHDNHVALVRADPHLAGLDDGRSRLAAAFASVVSQCARFGQRLRSTLPNRNGRQHDKADPGKMPVCPLGHW